MGNEIKPLDPVLNEGGELCWLTMKEVQRCNANPRKKIKTIIKDKKKLEKIQEFTLKPQGLWQCRKCGCILESTPTQPLECYEDKGGCGRKAPAFNVITRIINPDLWKIPKWEDIPVDDLDMLGLFNDTLDLLKKTLIFVEDIHYTIYALWLFSTYKLDSWNTLGTPFFVGLHNAGKSKGLDIIRELGWRMIHGSNCTFVAMIRASHVHSAGMLIDEVEDKLTHKTERGQQMLEFIKPAYRKGNKYIAGDKEDPYGIVSYKNYAFRAIAGEILRDNAMLSRCIPFDMEKDIPEIEDITDAQDDFDKIQTALLNYKYKTSTPPKLPEDFVLHGRIREIFESIIRTGMHIGVNVGNVIEFAQRYERETLLEFQNSIEREILQHIYDSERSTTLDDYTDDAPETIKLKELRDKLGWNDDNKAMQKLGYILRGKSMGLHTFHTRDGAVIKFVNPKTRRKLTYLYKRYGVANDE